MIEGKRAGSLRISVFGAFRVENENGDVLTPKGRKAQAILALLAVADTMSRSRAFLQDKLWSDRGPEQAAGSLRQALSEIRRALGTSRDILCADRSNIWLDADRVSLAQNDGDVGGGREFLEGLDIRDSEFNLWLASARASLVEPTSNDVAQILQSKPVHRCRQIIFHLQSSGSGALGFLEEVMAELISRNLREQGNFDFYFSAPDTVSGDAVLIEIQGFAPGEGNFAVRSSIQSVSGGQVVWSDMQYIPSLPALDFTPAEILAASSRVSDTILASAFEAASKVQRMVDLDANLLAMLGMHKIFLIRPHEAEEAENLLLSAFERSPRGVYLAWLAQLNTIRFVEGYRPRDEMEAQATDCVAQALEREGGNSQVLTVAANCAMIFNRDPALGGHLARQAVRANPANAMAWWVLGQIQLYDDQYEESYKTSVRGQRLAQGTHLQFWLDFQRSLAASFCGKHDEARVFGQSASVLRPEFRAAHRFALSLHAAWGDTDRANRAWQRLAKLEAGFTPSRFVEDKNYPVNLFRQMPHYAPEKLLELEAKA